MCAMYIQDVRNEFARFEALRRLLHHEALVTDLGPIFAGFDPEDWADQEIVEEVLVRYARALRASLDGWWDWWTIERDNGHISTSQPVLPVVDLAKLRVSHETCGASEYWLEPPSSRGAGRLGYSNSHHSPTPCEVSGLRLGGYRDPDQTELGTAGWHAARSLLARTAWSGGCGPLALQIAERELRERGIDPALIELVVADRFCARMMRNNDEALAERLETERLQKEAAAATSSGRRSGSR